MDQTVYRAGAKVLHFVKKIIVYDPRYEPKLTLPSCSGDSIVWEIKFFPSRNHPNAQITQNVIISTGALKAYPRYGLRTIFYTPEILLLYA